MSDRAIKVMAAIFRRHRQATAAFGELSAESDSYHADYRPLAEAIGKADLQAGSRELIAAGLAKAFGAGWSRRFRLTSNGLELAAASPAVASAE